MGGGGGGCGGAGALTSREAILDSGSDILTDKERAADTGHALHIDTDSSNAEHSRDVVVRAPNHSDVRGDLSGRFLSSS